MKTKNLLVLLFMGMLALPMSAQSVITEQESVRQRTPALNGKAAVVFKSASAELVITTALKDDPVCDAPQKVNGAYEYRMVFDISEGHDSKVFTIALKGTTISKKTKQYQLKPNETRWFGVELVSNPITMEPAPDGSNFIGEGNGWALIEFNSETPLTIKHHDDLPCKIKHGRSKAGIYVDSLIVNVEGIQNLYAEVKAGEAKLNELEEQVDKVLETATDDEMARMDQQRETLTAEIEKKTERLNDLSLISVKGDGTNERFVELDAVQTLQSKGKLRYNIVLLTKTQTVFKTRYEEMIHQAESYKQTRDYAAAKRFYESAAQAEGAIEADKQVALHCAEKMGALAEIKSETDRVADRLYELSNENRRVNKEAFFALIDDVSQRYDALYKETGETFYKDEAERLRKEKDNIGFVFKGRCVTSDYKGGKLQETPLGFVNIYGSTYSRCDQMSKKDCALKGELITTTNAAGTFSLTLKDGRYKTLIFEATTDKKIKKNKHVSLEGRTGDRNVKIRFSMD